MTVWLLAVVAVVPAALAQDQSPPEGNLLADLFDDVRALPSWENTFWLLGGAGLTLGAHEIEDPAGARRALDQGIIDPLVDSGNIYGDIRVQAPLAMTVWASGHFRNRTAVSDLGYDLVRALSLNYFVTGTMKPSFDRTRPNGEDYSFPSGHSSAAFATAAIGAAVLTGLGRMEDLKHYASDVTAGATLGWVIGRTVARSAAGNRTPVDATPDGEAWRLSPAPGGLLLSRSF